MNALNMMIIIFEADDLLPELQTEQMFEGVVIAVPHLEQKLGDDICFSEKDEESFKYSLISWFVWMIDVEFNRPAYHFDWKER